MSDTYFKTINRELFLQIILKLRYEYYIKINHFFVGLDNPNSEYLIKLKNFIIHEKISRVLNFNTELKFIRYNTSDKYIWDIIFIDLMNGLKFLACTGEWDLSYFIFHSHNQISINLISLIRLLKFYPSIYKYVQRYINCPNGPWLFFRVIHAMKNKNLINLSLDEYQEHKFILQEVVEKMAQFAETGDFAGIIKIDLRVVPKTEGLGLMLALASHMLISSVPRDKIILTSNMIIGILAFSNFLMGREEPLDRTTSEEYTKYKTFWNEIFKDISKYKSVQF